MTHVQLILHVLQRKTTVKMYCEDKSQQHTYCYHKNIEH